MPGADTPGQTPRLADPTAEGLLWVLLDPLGRPPQEAAAALAQALGVGPAAIEAVRGSPALAALRVSTAPGAVPLLRAGAAAFGPDLLGVGSAGLAARLLHALEGIGGTLALAESCTAGGATARLGAVPGASRVLLGAVVSYANRIKEELLGVPRALLAEHGAVSDPVVRAMAEGVRARMGSDLSLAISGVAGPGGGTREKPVGTVFFAASDGEGTVSRRAHLAGDRGTVQAAAAELALAEGWRRLVARGRARPVLLSAPT